LYKGPFPAILRFHENDGGTGELPTVTRMFSGLSKLLDRSFVLGFFLPALLFLVSMVELFGRGSLIEPIVKGGAEPVDSLAGVSLALVSVFLLGVLLLTTNYFMYRFLEGYLKPISQLKILKYRQLKKFDTLEESKAANDIMYANARTRFPSLRAEVMPTSFGNAIRAFEVYPRDTYGVDSISTWSRLTAVISKDFQAQIEIAKSQIDFFVNVCFLSAITSIFGVARLFVGCCRLLTKSHILAFYPSPILDSFANTKLNSGIAIVAGTAIAAASYRCATLMIPQWGESVKAAFDCYLPVLAIQLGYVLPESGKDRRRFWGDFSRMLLYGDKFRPEEWRQVSNETIHGVQSSKTEAG
jgi:hypothetical protein